MIYKRPNFIPESMNTLLTVRFLKESWLYFAHYSQNLLLCNLDDCYTEIGEQI